MAISIFTPVSGKSHVNADVSEWIDEHICIIIYKQLEGRFGCNDTSTRYAHRAFISRQGVDH